MISTRPNAATSSRSPPKLFFASLADTCLPTLAILAKTSQACNPLPPALFVIALMLGSRLVEPLGFSWGPARSRRVRTIALTTVSR